MSKRKRDSDSDSDRRKKHKKKEKKEKKSKKDKKRKHRERECDAGAEAVTAALTHSAVGDSHSGRDAAATKQSSNASSGSTSEHRGAPAAAYVTINARKTPRARRI